MRTASTQVQNFAHAPADEARAHRTSHQVAPGLRRLAGAAALAGAGV